MPSPCVDTEICRARPLLGTLVEIRAAMPRPGTPSELNAAIDAAFDVIAEVQRLMSFHDDHSDVSRLNHDAVSRPVCVDAKTWEVLETARRFSQWSDGAFDVCIGDVLQRWGVLPAAAGPEVAGGNWRDIELLDGQRVRFHRPLRIDLGGIAKGYAVDRAVEVLRRAGAFQGLVNAGGDLRTFGPAARLIALRDARSPTRPAHMVEVREAALATSAAYFSRRLLNNGVAVCALVDPLRQRPCPEQASVSVLAADCLSADALTKVVLFAPLPVASRVLEVCGAQAWRQEDEDARAQAVELS